MGAPIIPLDDDGHWAELIGPVYTEAEFAEVMQVPREAILWRPHLLRLLQRGGGEVYPAFQLDDRPGILHGIEPVVWILTGWVETEWTIASWLRSPQAVFDGATPHAELEAGNANGVIRAALVFQEALRT